MSDHLRGPELSLAPPTQPEQQYDPQQLEPMAANAEAASNTTLTLSFQGEVFVFESVSPDKVQAVLLLLGGRELAPGLGSETSPSTKAVNFVHRMASIIRYREKCNKRNFGNKIRYSVRKEIAHRMQRHKGQFTSAKAKAEEATTSRTASDSSSNILQ